MGLEEELAVKVINGNTILAKSSSIEGSRIPKHSEKPKPWDKLTICHKQCRSQELSAMRDDDLMGLSL
jgi:hypothetical protein